MEIRNKQILSVSLGIREWQRCNTSGGLIPIQSQEQMAKTPWERDLNLGPALRGTAAKSSTLQCMVAMTPGLLTGLQ